MLLMFGTISFGACEYKCAEPYDLSSSASRLFSSVTGQRYISQEIGELILKKSILQNISSKNLRTEIKSFSTRDLKAGRFKSLEIEGKNVVAQGVNISYFKAKTLCDFNYITVTKSGDVIIKEDMPLAVEVVMTEDDINKTMESAEYKRLVDDINGLGGSFNIFQINSTYVRLKNNKMYYVMKYTIPFVKKPKEVVLSADLRVENGEIKLANTALLGNSMSLDLNKFSAILNYINPLDFSVKIQENRNAKFNISNIKIEDKKISIDGIMIVLKDKE